jgi:hypothetical protein
MRSQAWTVDPCVSPVDPDPPIGDNARVKSDTTILFSGAAQGAEAAFGEAAERHGIQEVNFTFEGHSDARTRGIRVLTTEELQHGDVSLSYVSRLMNRKYPDTPLFRKVLQSIWHQVNHGHEIFVVGTILPDHTVRGGTGVAAEYAKFFNKPLYVFDQTKNGWLRWTGDAWQPAKDPAVAERHFTGTGTRFLEASGREAIDALFARSFR